MEITQKDYDALKRHLDASNREIVRLEGEVNDLVNRNKILEQEKDQWIRDKIRWQAMVQDQMDKTNKKNNEYLQVIDNLNNQVKAK